MSYGGPPVSLYVLMGAVPLLLLGGAHLDARPGDRGMGLVGRYVRHLQWLGGSACLLWAYVELRFRLAHLLEAGLPLDRTFFLSF